MSNYSTFLKILIHKYTRIYVLRNFIDDKLFFSCHKMNPVVLLCCLMAVNTYPNADAQRNGRQNGGRQNGVRQNGGRQRDAAHQMPPGGMQGPPPGMPQEQGN